MSPSLEELRKRTAQIVRLAQVYGLLEWDQQTYMPPGAAEARAEQCATLSRLIHDLMTTEEYGGLLAQSEQDLDGADPDSDDARLLVVARRHYDQATRVPSDLVAELARHAALSQEVWVRARQQNDFAAFMPYLKRMVELTRRMAECLGYKSHIYDALIDRYEPGTTTADVAAMFSGMKPQLVALVHAIAASPVKASDAALHGDFPVAAQRDLTWRVVQALGYDTHRGRQDEAAHPFCSNFSRNDVRITTRFDPGFLSQALYASIHETGHALYEQGSPPQYEGTEMAGGASLGVHESQSRLWENMVGRSRAFSRYLLPLLKSAFPAACAPLDAETLYRAANRVAPSFIRVEADEVTYNLHILLRFELECRLLEGSLTVEDLPAAWNQKMQENLGITPPDDSLGCLQDVHWSGGLIGYFPTYSIGNLLAGQLWRQLRADIPDMPSKIESGEFAPILDWLREHVHRYGAKYFPRELVLKATGEPLSAGPFTDYLREKYDELYRLS